MAITYSADEIYEIAEQIERNGAKFYRKAAEGATDTQVQELFLKLASMEVDHEKAFARLRAAAQEAESQWFDPDGQAALYLRAIADGHVFDVKTDPSEAFKAWDSARDVLSKAILLEKDSVVFYVAIQQAVPEGLGRQELAHIIEEELSHITTLSRLQEDLPE